MKHSLDPDSLTVQFGSANHNIYDPSNVHTARVSTVKPGELTFASPDRYVSETARRTTIIVRSVTDTPE